MKWAHGLSLATLCSLFASPLVFAGQYLIQGSDLSALKNEVAHEGGRVSHDLRYHPGFVAHLAPQAAARIQKQHGSSVIVEEDVEFFAIGKPGSTTPTQPLQTTPWGISAVRAPESAALTRGAGVIVCVVDTGIQGDHPDLKNNVIGGENFVVQKGFVNPSLWADDNSHGTHVSGTIAAEDNGIGVIGVAPQAKLFAAKVLNRNGSGYMSAIADGIRSCVAHQARVINMSLGGPSSSATLEKAVQDAKAAGVILVAAAGNESADTMTSYPAAYPQVIAVSAMDVNHNFAYFSNYGTKVAYIAPGVSILSTVKGSAYATYSGTSMASPHVAGVAALMIASGSLGLVAQDIGLPATQQGQGLIDSLQTVQNQPAVITAP